MGNLSKKPYKGTRDFFPQDMRVRDYIFSKMTQTAKSFGYDHYDGPLLEELDLYRAKSGEELVNEQLYSFADRGKREVAIRPEMTPTLARMVASIHKEEAKPLRWFSIPNVMRYERPQKGRLREHWQLNCDIFGAPELLGEVEILQMIISLMKSLGADNSHFEITLNDRTLVDALFKKSLKIDEDNSYKLYKIIDRSKKISKDQLNKDLEKINLDSNQELKKYLSLKNLTEATEFFKELGFTTEVERLESLQAALSELNLLDYIVYDPSIVRGLDYYTGIVFEVFDKHPDNRRAICGGGTYANLLQIFNESPLPGSGFGMGDVTLTDFLNVHRLMPDFSRPANDVFLATTENEGLITLMNLATSLRQEGLSVMTHLEAVKMKKIFTLADKKGARFCSILGSEELAQNTITLRNIEKRENKQFKQSDLSAILQFLQGNQ